LIARFDAVLDAVNSAAEMHRALATQNAGIPEDQHLHLRAGVNSAVTWSDGLDIYGTGVNLAARLATLAGPGETLRNVQWLRRPPAASLREVHAARVARLRCSSSVRAPIRHKGSCFLAILTPSCLHLFFKVTNRFKSLKA
jgi:class 3 adenylate cyclase